MTDDDLCVSAAADRAPSLDFDAIRSCTACGLRETCRQVVVSSGPLRTLIMVVGEAPGYYEDQEAKPFVGKAGNLLNDALAEAAIFREHCYVTNAVKCLRYTSRVQLADGRWERISRLVNTRYLGEVMSVGADGGLVPRRVTGWYRTPLGNRRVFKLRYRSLKKAGPRATSIELTGDHPVLTKRGYVRADQLLKSDLVATGQGISEVGTDVLYGTLLGDGHLRKQAPSLEMVHCVEQGAYARYKASLLKEFDPVVSEAVTRAESGGRFHRVVRVRTRAKRALRIVRQAFYPRGKKIVPEWLELTPRMLAIWFLDDGHMRIREGRKPNAEIATCGFDLASIQVLVSGLKRLGVQSRVRNGRIVFDVVATEVLSRLIAPHVPESMRRKLHPKHRSLPFRSVTQMGPRRVLYDTVECREIFHKGSDKSFFCIDVEETHNFVTAGGVVHNCRPPQNRKPEPAEVEACSKHLLAEIAEVRPKVIVALGATPLSFFAGKDSKGGGITKRRGRFFEWKHPDGFTCVILPTYHPAYVCRKPNLLEDFLIDLQAAKWFLTGDSRRLPRGEGTRTRKPYPGTFVGGYHSGERVSLIYRDDQGNRRLRQISPEEHPWYFLIFEGDITAKVRPELEVVLRRGAPYKGGSQRIQVKDIKPDPECKGWLRIYPTIPENWVSKEVKAAMSEEEGRLYTTVSPVLALARALEVVGIRTFEADLDPLRRFMTDNDVTIGRPKRLWFDIETDDEAMPGATVMEVIGKVPILGIGGEDDEGKNQFCLVNETGDEHGERLILEKFFSEIMPKYDMLLAFNGEEFDFPFLKLRALYHGFKIPWYEWVQWDSLVSFKKHHTWDAEAKSGYSLKNISRQILGEEEEKLDRKLSIKELWRNHRQDFIDYNLRDVLSMRRIEEETGYVSVDEDMSAIGNCFANNVYVSFRVDGLALMEGYRRGVHFRSKEMPNDREDQFIGAFVLDPQRGIYDNVANFDFASLYPSVFTSWNISPDTYVPQDEIGDLDPASVVRCPRVEVEGKKVGGSTFLREPMGVLPTIYRRVKVERDRCKKEMAKYPVDSPEWWVEKRHEYAFKQLGLSIYGAMGSVYSRFFNRDVAEAVTITSQYLIRTTLKLAEQMGFKPLYGDTDSVFIQIDPMLVTNFLRATEYLYGEIAKRHQCSVNQIELEYEQFFKRIAFLAKKRYAGWLTVQKGREADVLEVKGLEMRRSDGVVLTRRIQKELISGVIRNGWDLERAKDFILKLREDVFGQRVSSADLAKISAITRSPERYAMRLPHVEIAKRMIAAGQEVYIGSKIAYIVVDGRKPPLVALTVEEFEALPERRYDAHYYWMNQTWPALERVLEVLWPEENWGVFDAKRERKKREPKSGLRTDLPNGGVVPGDEAPSDLLGNAAVQLLDSA